MSCDNDVEEFLSLQEKIPQQIAIQEKALSEEITDKMVIIEDDVELKLLYIAPTEKFMDEYVGTLLEMKGLFKVHDTSARKENLQQIICSTAKEWFEKSNGEMNLFALNYTKDEQISIQVNRTGSQNRRNVEKNVFPQSFY